MHAWRLTALPVAVILSCGLSQPAATHAATAVVDLSSTAAASMPRGTAPGEDPLSTASADARWTIAFAREAGDAAGLPFAVVDKRDARVWVFDDRGRLVGQSAVLTGLARGDGSVPGIGSRPVSRIRPSERTTPAGRFLSQPGRNLAGEAVVWVDYDTGIAIHRLRPGASEAVRARSLASPTPDDNRQSYGCVVVPPAFFDAVVAPVLGRGRAVVYVMPEERPVQALFRLRARGTEVAGVTPR